MLGLTRVTLAFLAFVAFASGDDHECPEGWTMASDCFCYRKTGQVSLVSWNAFKFHRLREM